jgi:hypothetical protein
MRRSSRAKTSEKADLSTATLRIDPGVALESVYNILDLYKIPVLKGLG